jgi:iron complex outermembrane receptor protein
MHQTKLNKTLLAALIAEICLPVCVSAQTVDEPAAADAPAKVVVSGIRASLTSSLMTKRNQDGVVDAVSAEDAGKFPDTNVAESLQRVTGVQIDRNNGEGRSISVRGLGPEFNNVLINGRTMTSDTGSRSFSFDLLSSDLISKALVYKTSQAFLPEGGIGSTVDIQTTRPLSGKIGHSTVINVADSYDTNSKKNTPNVSGLYSFSNSARTFGVSGSLSYTDRASRQYKAINDAWNYLDVSMINGNQNSTGLTMADVTTKKLYIPQSYGFQDENERRKRLVANATIQYNPSPSWKLTADALYSRLNQRNNVIAISDWINPQLLNVKYDANGQITSFERPGSAFAANNPVLDAAGLLGTNSNDMIVKGDSRLSISQGYGLNSKWLVSQDWKVDADAWTSKTNTKSPNMWIVAGMVPVNSDLLTFGTTPTLAFGDGITDPTAVRAHAVSFGDARHYDKLHEGRLNASWTPDMGVFKGLDMGAAYSTRDFESISWGADSWNAFSGYHVGLPSSLFTVSPLGNPFGNGGQVPSSYLSFDPTAYMNYLNQPSMLPFSNDPAYYSNLAKFPNGPMAIDYTIPSSSGVKEKVANVFFQTKWEGSGWTVDAGLRLMRVNSTSTGTSRVVLSAVQSPNDTTFIQTFGPMTTQSVSNTYGAGLPSANVKFDLTSDMLLRLGASKTLTRPNLGDMGVDNWYGGRAGYVTSGGGNPYLRPMRSKNYDVSYEWYLSKTNYVSSALFMKKLSDFIEQQLLDIQSPLFTEVVHDTRWRNGQKGTIKGAELAGQFAFDNRIPLLDGFGVAANYTYVDAKAVRNDGTDPFNCGYPGLSRQSYNASAFFENSRFQVRASYNWRSHYVASCNGGSQLPTRVAAYGQTDGSLRFNITPTISLYADIINMTNAKKHVYADNETQFMALENVGRRYNAGVRMSF